MRVQSAECRVESAECRVQRAKAGGERQVGSRRALDAPLCWTRRSSTSVLLYFSHVADAAQNKTPITKADYKCRLVFYMAAIKRCIHFNCVFYFSYALFTFYFQLSTLHFSQTVHLFYKMKWKIGEYLSDILKTYGMYDF